MKSKFVDLDKEYTIVFIDCCLSQSFLFLVEIGVLFVLGGERIVAL